MPQPTHDDPGTAPDPAQFVPLRSVSALGELVERSAAEPVVLFQHDPYCPISRKAYRELAGAPVRAAVVDVAEDEHLSRTIEQRTGVRHESPQVLVFRSGMVVWNASHFKITRRAVTRAVQRAATGDVVDEPESEYGGACGTRGGLEERPSESLNLVSWLHSLWDRQ
jgi:bacillithiol system protein YtxJ